MPSEAQLSQLLVEFDAELARLKGVSSGSPCETWKGLRPVVINLIGVLNGIAILFPKAKLAADTLQAIQTLLDQLCPTSARLDLADDDLAIQLKQAIQPAKSASDESPCSVWSRLQPVVRRVIEVLQVLAPEVPVLGQVAQALDTLSNLADSLCGHALLKGGAGRSEGRADDSSQILIWEDDPVLVSDGTNPPVQAQPIAVDVPANTQPLLKTQISGTSPPPGKYSITTPEFRYWNAEAALDRGANYWGPILPVGTQWSSDVSPLAVELDEGVDFNAFYSRENGLNFFHGLVSRARPSVTVYSGESPHVICHELGHAILDAVKPELFETASTEVGAFHEGFADCSSMLCALQLESVRKDVLNQTGGRLNANSRLSQMARQLGWAIRVQISQDAVDVDSLRNTANRFFYRNPAGLPPNGPASSLSSEFHSFSRVFSGAFLDVLAGMFSIGPSTALPAPADKLKAVANDAGILLIEGIRLAAVAPGFYGQVAAGMIQADTTLNGGHYKSALTTAFIRRGILAPSAAVSLVRDLESAKNAAIFGVTGVNERRPGVAFAKDNEGFRLAGKSAPQLPLSPITTRFGLTLHVAVPAELKRFPMFAATLAAGVQQPHSPEEEAQEFVEDLIQSGQISHERLKSRAATAAMVAFESTGRSSFKTHYLIEEDDRLVLKRHHFDCRWDRCSH